MIQGQQNVELSAVGLKQAELVAGRLAGERFDLVYSSDLSRASKVASYRNRPNLVASVSDP